MKLKQLLLSSLLSVGLIFTGCSLDTNNSSSSTNKSSSALDPAHIHFIDVGQGDAIFIQCGDFTMLIDAGDNGKGDDVVDYLKQFDITELDYFVATHMDADHIGGADEVLEAFEVKNIVDSGATKKTTQTYERYVVARDNEGAYYREDDNFTVKVNDNLSFNFIETGDNYSDENDNSVVIEMVYLDKQILFTGDMETQSEMASLDLFRDVDILKSAHHGSRTSSSEEFLDIVKAEYAVISAGEGNKYGHPHQEVLDRYDERNMEVYRTDLDGTIICVIDTKGNISWTTEK
ncbi:MAG: hypothetical protein ATN36_08870 [Epulopiscium sp. Nele67-Bin005]|nr:MAG: hypothetical protein ATN36_08870 [Epulopiscium sp. Nele67-Bin005]